MLDITKKRHNKFNDIYDIMNNATSMNDFPYVIDVELTNKCNLQCDFCSRKFMERQQGMMEDSTFKEILKQIAGKEIGIRFIRWGEPFLHKKILDYSKEIKHANIPLHITTNGQLLNKKICKSLVSMQLDSITFSMQGLGKIGYEKQRYPAKYETIRNNTRLLNKIRKNKEKPYITVSTTYVPFDGTVVDYVCDFKDYWLELVDDVNVGVTNYSRINNTKGKHIVCKEPWQKLSIDWDGNVSACCGDFDRLLNIGNINDTTLYDLWNKNDVLNAYRTLIKNNKHDSLSLCSKCYPAHGDVWKSE